MASAVQPSRLCIQASSRICRTTASQRTWNCRRRAISSTATRQQDGDKSNGGRPSRATTGASATPPSRAPQPSGKRPVRIKKLPWDSFKPAVRPEEETLFTLHQPASPEQQIDDEEEDDIDDAMEAEGVRDTAMKQAYKDLEEAVNEADEIVSRTDVPAKFRRVDESLFWGEDEEDEDFLAEGNEDEDEADDITTVAHGKVEEHREHREYARIAAWQMPLLSKLAKPFVPPQPDECLRFRFTTFMGESHPASRKVVMEFAPDDMPLTLPQKLKLKKLLGPRWNPETELAKMSCDQYEHQAQNKRYLSDVVQKLLDQARDSKDMFEDVPIDTRHHKIVVKPKFPPEWRMTEDRRLLIDQMRADAQLADKTKIDANKLIDGDARVISRLSVPELDPMLLPTRPMAVNSFRSATRKR